MFKLSKGAEYAIRGILYLSMQPNDKVSYVEEIAEAQEVPRAYLAKIFQTLSKKGYVKSTRGPGGGFRLIVEPKNINMLGVIEAMEGDIKLNECLIRVGYCHRDSTCPLHDVWCKVQDKILRMLSQNDFETLAKAGLRKLEMTASEKAKEA